jgi:hypothetical protein
VRHFDDLDWLEGVLHAVKIRVLRQACREGSDKIRVKWVFWLGKCGEIRLKRVCAVDVALM